MFNSYGVTTHLTDEEEEEVGVSKQKKKKKKKVFASSYNRV